MDLTAHITFQLAELYTTCAAPGQYVRVPVLVFMHMWCPSLSAVISGQPLVAVLAAAVLDCFHACVELPADWLMMTHSLMIYDE